MTDEQPKWVFTPSVTRVATLERAPKEVEAYHDEPMLHSAGWDFARECGGPITQSVMDMLQRRRGDLIDAVRHGMIPKRWLVIDTRVHMLMDGMYPAIPGWHGDGFPRTDRWSQPDLKAFSPTVRHFVFICGTQHNISQTEYCFDEVEIPGLNMKAIWHDVDKHVCDNPCESYFQTDGELVEFDQRQLHRATAATGKGWRFFFRCTVYHRPPTNVIRKQVQVYTTEGSGW